MSEASKGLSKDYDHMKEGSKSDSGAKNINPPGHNEIPGTRIEKPKKENG